MFSWCFLSVLMYFSIVRNLSREPDFWAENRIFKNFSKILKTCFVGVFWVFQGIFSHCSTSEPRTGFLSREPDFQKILKKPQNMFSWCFLIVSYFFLALFDIWAENRIFEPRTVFKKRKFKSLLTCLGGVFWMFQSIFSIVRHLSWEPDFWAKNRVFTNFVKWLKTCLINMSSIVAVNR